MQPTHRMFQKKKGPNKQKVKGGTAVSRFLKIS